MKMLRVLPALLFFSFISWIIVQANKGIGNIFFEIVHLIPYGDKLGHFSLFACLSLLTIIAFNYKYLLIKEYRIPFGAVIVLILAIAEEVTQLFLPNRNFDVADILADIAGIFIVVLVFNKFSANTHSAPK